MSTSEVTAVRAEMTAMAAPLRAKLAELEKLIEARVAELEELRGTRNEARKMLAIVDPSSVPAKKATKTTVATRVSQETVAAVEKRLHDKLSEVNGDGGFTATSLRREHGFGDFSQSTLSKALAALHERDLIRLDHRGRGGAHYFKVVA